MMNHLDWVGTGRVLTQFLNGLLEGLHHNHPMAPGSGSKIWVESLY